MVQDYVDHGSGFFVLDWYHHGNLGEGVGHAEHMFVVAQGFEGPKKIHMDSLISFCWDWQRGPAGRLGIAFSGSLAAGTLLDVPGGVKFHGLPPPKSPDSFLCPFSATLKLPKNL